MARPARRIALLAAVVAALAGAALPSAAFADAFDRVFADYQRDGQIDACKHTEAALKGAKAQVPNDIEQYAPDFPAALDAALEERARGGCRRGATRATEEQPGASGGGGAPPVPDGGQPGGHANDRAGATPAPPGVEQAAPAAADGAIERAAAPGQRQSEADAPAPLIVLAVLGGLLLLALLTWALTRWLAWSPGWAAPARHAMAEAGWRASGFWGDFRDWVRTRRQPA